MYRQSLCVLCCALLAASVSWGRAPSAKPGDWPQFRGPERNGVSTETGLLESWPEGGPPLVWKATGVGRGFSTVSVAGDNVFTMGDVGDSCYLFCLNRADGEHRWKVEIGRKGGNYEGPRCTPTVDGNRVYALGQFGDLVCVACDSGEEVWRKNLGKDFGGRSGGWNYTESPLIDGEKLICTPGGSDATMVALNKETGDVIWKGQIPGGDNAGYASAVIAEIGATRQYVNMLANGLASFSAADGKLLWRFGTTGDRYAGNTANIPTPIVIGDNVFAAVGYGRGGAMCHVKYEGGEFHPEEVYFSRDLVNKHGGVILVGKYLYGDKDDSGLPWCAEAETGKIMWKKNKRTEGRNSAAITYADGHLYIRYQNGIMALVKASTDEYEEVSSFQIPDAGNSWPHPVIAGGKLYLREQDTLYVHDISAK